MALPRTEPDQFFSVSPDNAGLREPASGLPWWLVSLGTLLIIGMLTAGIFLGSHFQVQRIGGQTPVPYADASGYLDAIIGEEKAGKWQIAANTAETAIDRGTFSPADTTSLKQHAIADELHALAAETFPAADANAQQQAVDEYQSVKRRGQAYGEPIPSFRAVAEDAYNTGHFLLAKVAFEDALARGDISLNDQLQVKFYCSTLFNLGKWYAEHGATSEVRDQGLHYLSASFAIDNQYQIGSGAAWGELTTLLGPDESRWPTPAASPLLGTGGQSGTEVHHGSPR